MLLKLAATLDRVNRQVLDLLGVDFSPRIVLIFTTPLGGKTRLDVACEGKGDEGRPPHRNIVLDPPTGERRYWASPQSEGTEPQGCYFVLPAGADETDPNSFRCVGSDGQPCKPAWVEMDLRSGERVVELRCRC